MCAGGVLGRRDPLHVSHGTPIQPGFCVSFFIFFSLRSKTGSEICVFVDGGEKGFRAGVNTGRA